MSRPKNGPLDAAATYKARLQALSLLALWPPQDRAAKLVIDPADELDGDAKRTSHLLTGCA
jgi:hypothetical protein